MFSILICSGCGTMVARVGLHDELGDQLYPATTLDMAMVKGCLDPDGVIFARKSYLGAALTVVDVPVSVATDTVLLPVDLARRHEYRKKDAQRQEVEKEVESCRSMLRQTPQVMFEEHWHLSKNEAHLRAIVPSLGDPHVPFTEDMIARLIDENPMYKNYAFRHPCCSTQFLVDHFDEALERANGISYSMLAAIVSHPNTPTELIHPIAESQTIPVGAVHPAQRELKRRRELQHSPAGDSLKAAPEE